MARRNEPPKHDDRHDRQQGRHSWRPHDRQRALGTLAMPGLRHSRISLAVAWLGILLSSLWLTWRLSFVSGVLFSGLALLAFLALAVPVLVFLTPAYRIFPAWKALRQADRALIDVPVPLTVVEEAERLAELETLLTTALCTLLISALLGAETYGFHLLRAMEKGVGSAVAGSAAGHVTFWPVLTALLSCCVLIAFFCAGNAVLTRGAVQVRQEVAEVEGT
ncbi:hypothetical protein E3E11_03070 [Oecophyllibacter saccharovorans]|uniref:hypothetical protein n=1 Tax=Oecophyllibacter saccharovorans TaxID=2558360 RepID=UPI001142E028|nr:hypothetical protein [Oecophyllibacter saccharovorans]QDH15016.1 hypothetical protein E3E11_03070 [Oecophyllibacter saccharovorans]